VVFRIGVFSHTFVALNRIGVTKTQNDIKISIDQNGRLFYYEEKTAIPDLIQILVWIFLSTRGDISEI